MTGTSAPSGPPVGTRAGARREQRRRSRLGALGLGIGVIALVAVAVVLIWANPFSRTVPPGSEDIGATPPPQSLPQSDEPPQSVEASLPEEPAQAVFTIAAAGDMLIHTSVGNDAWNGESYDFGPQMERVSQYVQGADLSLCHMETPIAGPGEGHIGYPVFAAPYDLPAELARAGWDGCSTASNHSVDQGFSGLSRTLDAMDQAGLGHAGTARTPEEADEPQYYTMEKDGVSLRVAHIAQAHNLNGLPLPEEAPYSVSMLDIPRVIEQAKKAREDGADLVIFSLHCCDVEYVTDPEPLQEEAALAIAESGVVDIMISHHAHVPKPMKLLPGGPLGEGMWVAYGTGNFISNQGTHCCIEQTSTGALTLFDVLATEGEAPEVVDASWVAVTVDRMNGHVVEVLREQASDLTLIPIDEWQRRYALMREIMDRGDAPENFSPPQNPGTTTVIPRDQ